MSGERPSSEGNVVQKYVCKVVFCVGGINATSSQEAVQRALNELQEGRPHGTVKVVCEPDYDFEDEEEVEEE